MTPEQLRNLYKMMEVALAAFDSGIEEIAAGQMYATCLNALQLDRIATALERPVPQYDPHISTALNRVASATEGLLSVLPRG